VPVSVAGSEDRCAPGGTLWRRSAAKGAASRKERSGAQAQRSGRPGAGRTRPQRPDAENKEARKVRSTREDASAILLCRSGLLARPFGDFAEVFFGPAVRYLEPSEGS